MADVFFDTASDSGYTWIGRPALRMALRTVFDPLFSGVRLPFASKTKLLDMYKDRVP